MVFKRNKKYYCSLRENSEGHWADDNPLFISKSKGLFPIYRVNGRQGVMNKNYHEFELKNLPKKEKIIIKEPTCQNVKNVLSFKEEDWNI
tara:strand:+ start:491 stop:760 length:270 start_codon:yes stop_codon:yes gene_type:complete